MAKAINLRFGKSPFVTWKFVCKTPAEVKRNTRIANQMLNSFLDGFNAGLVSLGSKKNSFKVVDKVLKPLKAGSTTFIFKPTVFRKQKGGGVDLAGSGVPKPKQPNP